MLIWFIIICYHYLLLGLVSSHSLKKISSGIRSHKYFIWAQECRDLITFEICYHSFLGSIDSLILLWWHVSFMFFIIRLLLILNGLLMRLLILKHKLFEFGKKFLFTLSDTLLNYFFNIGHLPSLRKRPSFIGNIYFPLLFSHTQPLNYRLCRYYDGIFLGHEIPGCIKFMTFQLIVFLYYIVFQAGRRETVPDAD